MHFCVFFSQHFVICIILLFSYIQTVAVGLGRKYQETSVPLNVELISSTDVKYNYKERRLFNRRKGASFTLRSHFAHHICYTLDGSTPGCHDKSTNDNSKVHCKVVLSTKGDRHPKEGWAHGNECKRSGIGDNGAWCARHKKQTSYLRIDLKKREDTVGYAIQPRNRHDQATYKVKIDACDHGSAQTCNDNNMWFTVDDGKKYNGNMPRGRTNYWLFPKAVKARYFRIWPRMWRNHPSLRINMLSKVEGTPAIVDKINYNVSIQLPDDSSTRDYAVKAIGCDGNYGKSPDVKAFNLKINYPYDSDNASFVIPNGHLLFHCLDGSGGGCYDTVTHYDAIMSETAFLPYPQNYDGFKEYCSSWSANGGVFHGGRGPCLDTPMPFPKGGDISVDIHGNL